MERYIKGRRGWLANESESVRSAGEGKRSFEGGGTVGVEGFRLSYIFDETNW